MAFVQPFHRKCNGRNVTHGFLNQSSPFLGPTGSSRQFKSTKLLIVIYCTQRGFICSLSPADTADSPVHPALHPRRWQVEYTGESPLTSPQLHCFADEYCLQKQRRGRPYHFSDSLHVAGKPSGLCPFSLFLHRAVPCYAYFMHFGYHRHPSNRPLLAESLSEVYLGSDGQSAQLRGGDPQEQLLLRLQQDTTSESDRLPCDGDTWFVRTGLHIQAKQRGTQSPCAFGPGTCTSTCSSTNTTAATASLYHSQSDARSIGVIQ